MSILGGTAIATSLHPGIGGAFTKVAGFVTAKDAAGDSDISRANSTRGKYTGEVARLMTQQGGLTIRALGQRAEGVHELTRGEAGLARLGEDAADVGEKLRAKAINEV